MAFFLFGGLEERFSTVLQGKSTDIWKYKEPQALFKGLHLSIAGVWAAEVLERVLVCLL